MRKDATIFGPDMSSSVHIDIKKKDILILGSGPTQGLDDTTSSILCNGLAHFSASALKIFP